MRKREHPESKLRKLFAAIDELHVHRQAALEAENRATKTFAQTLFETLESAIETDKTANSVSEKLMTLQALADYLGYDPRTIQQWIADGGFPVLRAKDGADPRFDLTEVLDHMKQHRKNLRGEAAGNGKVSPLQRDCKQARSKANVSL